MTQNFSLNKLPEREINQRLAEDYPDMDVSAIETVMRLLIVSKSVGQSYTAFFAEHGLSDGKFALLAVLDERPRQAYAPSVLAQKIGVTRPAVTSIVDGLETDGLVERSLDVQDRRMQTIQLTQKGKDLLAQMMPVHYRRTALLMQNFTELERSMFAGLLDKMQLGLFDLT